MSYLKRSYFGGRSATLLLWTGALFLNFSLLPCLLCSGQESSQPVVGTNGSAAVDNSNVAEASAGKFQVGKFGGGTVMWAALIILGGGGVVASSLMLMRRRGRKVESRHKYVAPPVAEVVSAPAASGQLIGSTREHEGSSQATAGSRSAVAPKRNGRHRQGTRRRKSVDYTRFFMDLRSTVSDHSSYMEPELPAGFNLQPESMIWPETPAPTAPPPSLSATSSAASANSEMIANQRRLIEEQHRLIQEQTRLIEEKTRLLAEKSALLARQAELIDERLLPS
jgi:hypothetical protein